MRSPYMDILEQINWVPREWEFPTNVDAQIARGCLMSLAEKKGIQNLNIWQKGRIITAWHGVIERRKFDAPKKPKRMVGRYTNAERAQIQATFIGEVTA